MIRVGIIGCGWAGQRHYQSVVTASNAEVSAIADIDEDRLRKRKESWGVGHAFKNYEEMIDSKIESQMQILINLITAIRNVRANWNIDNYKKIDVVLKISESKIRKRVEENVGIIERLAKIENLTIRKSVKPPKNSARGVVDKIDFYVPLVNIIDISKEKERIKNQIKNQRELLVAINKRLKNKQFLKKAPKEVVLKEKKRQEELKEKVIKLKKIIKDLK